MTIIAVTGATGFLGGHVLARLEDICPDAALRTLTRRQQPSRPGVTWVKGALDDPESLAELVRDADVVIHLAGVVKARSASQFHAVNGGGTRAVIAAMLRHARHAGLIHISSLAARRPELSAYARSKSAAEEIVCALGADRPWTILRPPGIYGPGDAEIMKLLRLARRGVLPAPGHAGNRVSLIHARDLADLIARIAAEGLYHRRLIEVDDGHAGGYDYAELAQILSAVLRRPVRPVAAPSALLKTIGRLNSLASRLTGHTPMLTRDKARELCHPDWVARPDPGAFDGLWQPRISLADGLRETLDSMRKSSAFSP